MWHTQGTPHHEEAKLLIWLKDVTGGEFDNGCAQVDLLQPLPGHRTPTDMVDGLHGISE